MSNIDKRALREAAVRAGGEKWQYMRATQHSKAYITDDKGSTVVNCTDGDVPAKCAGFLESANPAAVLALLDELEAADALNKHLELAIRRAEGCSEALRRKLEAAEERIAELSELPMKSDVEKKPQNTLSGRPVYLGDGSDAKETLVAGKRDIHRYESSITDRGWKGD
ncbi:ead/Ea22-like family protein [Enterobacter hormaechei]|uniref:ead/Ea22-like family protein n=1 Tax=Enterobacter hormaechei TaxID=158836 RepID=UPI0039C2C3BA